MAYTLVLFIHSWVRWAVVISLVALVARSAHGLVKGRAWGRFDQRIGALFLSALDTQLVLGLLLYFVFSPITPKSFSDIRAFMPVPELRFFAVEHITGMLLAAVAVHLGWARGKKAKTDTIRFRRVLIGAGVAFLIIMASIPWPEKKYGRPLARSL